jgi:hypothetical protein
MDDSQISMKKSYFKSLPLNPYPRRKRLMDQSGT